MNDTLINSLCSHIIDCDMVDMDNIEIFDGYCVIVNAWNDNIGDNETVCEAIRILESVFEVRGIKY